MINGWEGQGEEKGVDTLKARDAVVGIARNIQAGSDYTDPQNQFVARINPYSGNLQIGHRINSSDPDGYDHVLDIKFYISLENEHPVIDTITIGNIGKEKLTLDLHGLHKIGTHTFEVINPRVTAFEHRENYHKDVPVGAPLTL